MKRRLALLARCKRHYTLILLLAPSLRGLTGLAVLGRKVDATCLVLAHGVSRLAAVAEARVTLAAMQAPLLVHTGAPA